MTSQDSTSSTSSRRAIEEMMEKIRLSGSRSVVLKFCSIC